jgi:multidrug resistance efflux pump
VVVASRLNQSFVSRFCEQLAKTAKHKAFSGTGRRILVLAVAAIFITYLVLPWPHSLSIPCTLVSSQPRVYSAPFSGKLKKSYFRSGEWVSQGAILFELDTEDLVIQKAKLESEWKSRNQAMIRFLQASDTAKAGEEKSNVAAISKELAMINSKLENAIVFAQESGTVIQSELHQREGEMLSLGEPLLNFAPSRTHQVELRIPDHLGMEFRAGQQGRFATSAEPDQWRDIIVERVEMASTAMNGENFIKAIATTPQFDEATRFGLSGFARISVGNQPGWWILLQQPIRYVQRKVSQL